MTDQALLDRLDRIERMLKQLVSGKLDLEPEPREQVNELASQNEIMRIICSDNPLQAIKERERELRNKQRRGRRAA